MKYIHLLCNAFNGNNTGKNLAKKKNYGKVQQLERTEIQEYQPTLICQSYSASQIR